MATALKLFFDRRVIDEIGRDLRRAGVKTRDFEARAEDGLDALELTPRARHIMHAMREVLPADPPQALASLVASFGPPHASDELVGAGMAPFKYLPHALFIAEFGLDHPDEALVACEAVTRRFTAEYCVRPYVELHPKKTWAALKRWSKSPDPHVRRLVSEGLRPRLPWAPRLRSLQEDPRPAVALLEVLKDDPTTLVRRSVANHLGDIAKDHPDLAVEIARRWLVDAAPERRKLVAYGLRHLVKQGHRGALAALGNVGADVRIEGFQIPARVTLGDDAPFSFEVCATAKRPQSLVIDLVVHFVKANGKSSPKVFKVARRTLAQRERVSLSGRIRTAAMSTRTHYPGKHDLEVQVNGHRFAAGSFQLVDG